MESEKISRREFNKQAATAMVAVPALLSLPKPAEPSWRSILEAQVRETLASPTMGKESKWEKQALFFAPEPFLRGCQTTHGEIVAQKTLDVNLGSVSDYRCIYELTNRVNSTEFCGAPPETLLLDSFWTEKQYECDLLATVIGLTFILRSRSHNEFWSPLGYWQRLEDAAGCSAYPPADLQKIP